MKKDVLPNLEIQKKKILDNVAVNDDVVCGLCDDLILAARQQNHWQSMAFGYVWQADYFFYVASDMKEVAHKLNLAEKYIDKEAPSELLEKFYTLKHVLCESAFDTPTAFHYCLKALEVSEKLPLPSRIGANLGNLGAFFMEYGCYEEALIYSEEARVVMCKQENAIRRLRILLSNLIKIYLKLDKMKEAEASIQELEALSIAHRDLKIYIDNAYLLYYAKQRDKQRSLYYMEEMFQDGLMELPNRAYRAELLTHAFQVMLDTGHNRQAEDILQRLERIIQKEEAEPMLALCKLKIQLLQCLERTEELFLCYRDYAALYLQVQGKRNAIKAEGFRAKVRLEDAHTNYAKSVKELKTLHDLAHYDELTGVYNRRYLNHRQEKLLKSIPGEKIGIALIDVDCFKEYNDAYGHPAGDKVLQAVAECLRTAAKSRTEVFRYGGDEFACLFQGISKEEILNYIEQVMYALAKKKIEHRASTCAKHVTLSIGFGSKRIQSKEELFLLFDEVDSALYTAKKNGRNKVVSV